MPAELAESSPDSAQLSGDATFNPNESYDSAPSIAETPSSVAPSQEQAPPSLRDVISGNLGYQFQGEVNDDFGALSHLVQRANRAAELERASQQEDVYRQLGQQLAPRAQELGQFFQQQAAPKPQERKSWEPPPFDERILPLLTRDEATGLFVSKPGVDQSFARQANERVEWQRKFQENPASIVEAMMAEREKSIEERIFEKFRAEQARSQEQSVVYQIAQQNAGWFYQLDAAGQPVVNPATGKYAITEHGSRYLGFMNQVAQMGVKDPVHRDQLARALVGASQPQAEQSQRNGATDAQRRALASGQNNRNPLQALGSLDRRETLGSTDPSQQGLSLRARLERDLKQGGITDEDLRREFS